MRLRYKIEYVYEYAKNSVMIILTSPYFTKEYRCANIGNLPAVLNSAIGDFNELHKFKIEELENEEAAEKAKQDQANGKKYKLAYQPNKGQEEKAR